MKFDLTRTFYISTLLSCFLSDFFCRNVRPSLVTALFMHPYFLLSLYLSLSHSSLFVSLSLYLSISLSLSICFSLSFSLPLSHYSLFVSLSLYLPTLPSFFSLSFSLPLSHSSLSLYFRSLMILFSAYMRFHSLIRHCLNSGRNSKKKQSREITAL